MDCLGCMGFSDIIMNLNKLRFKCLSEYLILVDVFSSGNTRFSFGTACFRKKMEGKQAVEYLVGNCNGNLFFFFNYKTEEFYFTAELCRRPN